MKILVIEDNESFSLMLCASLREAGYEVDSALSGKAGIKTAVYYLPDLILLDYNLGDMTGYDVAMALKYMRNTASMPFILLSSVGDDQLIVASFKKQANCRGTMVKNNPVTEILAAVSAALTGR